MSVTAIFTIVTGIVLMQKLLGGIQLAFKSTHGMIIIIGALLSLLGFIIGIMVNIPASRRMSFIGKAIASSGSQPNAAQLQELQKLRNKSFAAAYAVAFLLFASLVLMSIVKYYY
jgi:hypothetical protein